MPGREVCKPSVSRSSTHVVVLACRVTAVPEQHRSRKRSPGTPIGLSGDVLREDGHERYAYAGHTPAAIPDLPPADRQDSDTQSIGLRQANSPETTIPSARRTSHECLMRNAQPVQIYIDVRCG